MRRGLGLRTEWKETQIQTGLVPLEHIEKPVDNTVLTDQGHYHHEANSSSQ